MVRDSEIYVLNDKIIDLQSQIIQIRDELFRDGLPVQPVLSLFLLLFL